MIWLIINKNDANPTPVKKAFLGYLFASSKISLIEIDIIKPATNKRIIFLDKGLIFGLKQVEISLGKINSITQRLGLFLGEIDIWDGATKTEIKNVSKKAIPSFVKVANKAIEDFNKGDSNKNSVSDELLKLAELKEKGILTQEEFDKKKQELLNS